VLDSGCGFYFNSSVLGIIIIIIIKLSLSRQQSSPARRCNNVYMCIFVCIYVMYILYYIILERSHTIGGLTNNGQTDRQTDGRAFVPYVEQCEKRVCVCVLSLLLFFSLLRCRISISSGHLSSPNPNAHTHTNELARALAHTQYTSGN